MRRHLLSIARSPLGYLCNLLATCMAHAEHLPLMVRPMRAAGDAFSNVCEVMCLRDGVQDDMLF